MSKPRFLEIRNFEKFQHYKDRPLIWIKLHLSILDDFEFQTLPDSAKFHAIALILLASRLANRIPNDAEFVRNKIGATNDVDLSALVKAKFLQPIRREYKNNSRQIKNDSETIETDSETLPEQLPPNVIRFDKELSHKSQGTNAALDSNLLSQNRTDTEKKRINTDTEQNEPKPVVVSCVGSEFSLTDCLAYVRRCARDGQPIKNEYALAVHLHKTGEADAFIQPLLLPETVFGKPRQFTNEDCKICHGVKFEMVGRSAIPCENCRDERGNRTGRQPVTSAA